MIRQVLLLTLLLLPVQDLLTQEVVSPNEGEAPQGPAEEATAWAELTRWLRPRPNPHRTSVSDIITRGRRSMFSMPPMIERAPPSAQESRVMTENEARRFMKSMEREFAELKVLFDAKKFLEAVEKAKSIEDAMEDKQVGPEQVLRKQEILVQARALAAEARDKVETQGVREVINQLQKMESAFLNADYPQVRDSASKIEDFVTTWSFGRAANKNVAEAKLAVCRDLVRRTAIREEFASIPLKLSFTVVSENGASTAVINDRSVREGDALSEHLLLKKIRKGQMTFVYKGEEIVYDFE
ncbi:MAG: hypothetical protein AB7F75_11050 [Planctomycetota bacterium]